MCHISGNHVSRMNAGCGCGCPVLLPVEEEIRSLEEHKKMLQDQIEVIDRKMSALRSVNSS